MTTIAIVYHSVGGRTRALIIDPVDAHRRSLRPW